MSVDIMKIMFDDVLDNELKKYLLSQDGIESME